MPTGYKDHCRSDYGGYDDSAFENNLGTYRSVYISDN